MAHSVRVSATRLAVALHASGPRGRRAAVGYHRLVGVRRDGGAADRGAQPGEQLVHPEGLGDVVVGAAVERLAPCPRSRCAPTARRPDRRPPRSARTTSAPSRSGRPRSSTTTSGWWRGGDAQRRGAVGCGDDVVAAGGQVDVQGAQQAVSSSTTSTRVTPRDRASAAAGPARRLRAGRETTMRQAAAGGVLGGERAAHGLGEPAGDAEPQPSGRRGRGRRGAGRRRRAARRRRGHPGPGVDDPQLDAVAVRAGPHRDRCARAVPERVVDEVGDHPLEQAGVGEDLGQPLVDLDRDARGTGSQVETGAAPARRRRRTRRVAARGRRRRSAGRRVEQVRDQGRQPVRGLLDGGGQLGAVVVGQVQVRVAQALTTAALIDASGLRRSWPTAGEQRGAQAVRVGRRSASAACAATCRLRSASSGRPGERPRAGAGRPRGRARPQPTRRSPVDRDVDVGRRGIDTGGTGRPVTRHHGPGAVAALQHRHAREPERLPHLLQQPVSGRSPGEHACAENEASSRRLRPGRGGLLGAAGGAVDDQRDEHGDQHDRHHGDRRSRGSAMDSVYSGGVRKKLSSRPPSRAASSAGPRPPSSAVATVARKKSTTSVERPSVVARRRRRPWPAPAGRPRPPIRPLAATRTARCAGAAARCRHRAAAGRGRRGRG